MAEHAESKTGTRIGPLITESAAATEELGRLIGAVLERGAFVGLVGDLGGGKTTFTRGLARGMGVTANVTSPTFQLVREYPGRIRLFHFDFYRLESRSDLADLDIDYSLEAGIVAAEWADRFEPPEASGRLIIKFEWAGDNRRRIELTECPARLVRELQDAISRLEMFETGEKTT